MAIITFKSNDLKETGQTMSLAAVATQMAIEHNYKILIVSTNFNDKTLERCFWEVDKKFNFNEQALRPMVGMESGIEGLVRAMVGSKLTPELIKNYSKIILRDRLDVLPSTNASEYRAYEEILPKYIEILQVANKYYDMVFVDISKRMPKQHEETIVQMSDLVLVNLIQRLNNIDEFIQLREKKEFYRRKHVGLLIGRYDSYSKYNIKNITRYLKERKPVLAIPYNTLFFEACSEGKIVDYFLKLKNIDEADRNYVFITRVTEVVDDIIRKLRELQMNS